MQELDSTLPVEIDAHVVDRLLTRRARLQQIASATAGALVAAEHRLVLANLRFLARLRDVALSERDRAAAEWEPLNQAGLEGQRAIGRMNRQRQTRQLSDADYDTAAQQERDARRALAAQAEPLEARMQRADMAARVCALRAARFGKELRLESPSTWPAHPGRRLAQLAAVV